MPFKIQILGSNSAIFAHGRHPTSQLLQIHKDTFLVDCGEGTQYQMQKYKAKPFKISCVFISHLHGDHYFGLIGLLTSFHLLRRTDKLTVVGLPGLKEVIKLQLDVAGTKLAYPLEFIETKHEAVLDKIYESERVEVFTFPLRHKIPCTAFLFKEKEPLKRINSEAIIVLNLTIENYQELRFGQDIIDADQVFHKNEKLTLLGYLPRSYAYCTDTLYTPSIVEYIKEVDLLYHETTFMKNEVERAKVTFHSTTVQAARIADLANAGRLLIGHFSSRYADTQPLLEECMEVFPLTIVAVEGVVYSIEREAPQS